MYHNLSSKKHTKKMYDDGALKVDVALISKDALQIRVQGRRFERITERPGKKKSICVVPDPFCTCTLINDFWYVEEDEKCIQYEKGLLEPSLAVVEVQPNNICTESHLDDASRVVPVATRIAGVLEELHANYPETESASSVPPVYIEMHTLFIKDLKRTKLCFVRVMCVPSIRSCISVRYKSGKVSLCGTLSHGFMPRDERRAAHTTPVLGQALIPEMGTARRTLPAHIPSVCGPKILGNQLMRGSLCRPGEETQDRLPILRNKLFTEIKLLSIDRTETGEQY